MENTYYNVLKLTNGKILKSKVRPPAKIRIVRGFFKCKTY